MDGWIDDVVIVAAVVAATAVAVVCGSGNIL